MTLGWAYGGAPPAMAAATVTTVEGVTFCISDRSGDLRPGSEQGFFFRDTRFVSSWELSVNGAAVEPLAVTRPAPYAAVFVTRCPPRPGEADSTLLVIRRRFVGAGMVEQVTVRNLGREPATIALVLAVGADFAGLFEVKEGRARHREGIRSAAHDATIDLVYQRGSESRGVSVSGSGDATATPGRLSWHLVVGPHAEAAVGMQVVPAIDGVPAPAQLGLDQPLEASGPATELAEWRREMPTVDTPDSRFRDLLRTSADDLGSLRISDPQHPERTVVAAGAPWFMTLFGRDSLLTSWMLLPLDAALALGTLQELAGLQGRVVNPVTEEEPGRILHEVRSGLDAEFALGGGNVYYGSIDATPLFVMLLGEAYRWGALGGPALDALLPHADRAIEWIEGYGDRDGDGFVEYHRATDRGLVNQGWKDSFDAISDSAGRLAEAPIALAEVQGYVYAAYLARARIAADRGDAGRAEDLRGRAAQLKRRFNEAFWLPRGGYYALALDGNKRPVDAVASNMGHCLWTGIADRDKAVAVAARLSSPDLFTGFGLRTLAASMGAYNPVSYHNGSVWPHDTAIAVAGLMRYGFVAEAQQLSLGLLAAGNAFGGRLPELFCGFDRAEFPELVPYPTSCSPQAWAAAAPLLVTRSLLRFDPDLPGGIVGCRPALPAALLPLRIDNIRLGPARVGVLVGEDGWQVTGLPPHIGLNRRITPGLDSDSPVRVP